MHFLNEKKFNWGRFYFFHFLSFLCFVLILSMSLSVAESKEIGSFKGGIQMRLVFGTQNLF